MRKLGRKPLTAAAELVLESRTQQVLAAPDPASEAQRLWKQQGPAFEEIRATLGAMASGRERCMYCEDSEGTDIEHFWPKSTYPERAFTWTNYLLACSRCNSNFKREQFPRDAAGAPLLIDPTVDEPQAHLVLSGRTGKLTALTPKGENSIEVFGLGRDLLEKGRHDAWFAIGVFLREYDEARARNDLAHADLVRQWLGRFPFSSVFVWFLRYAALPGASTLIDARSLGVLQKYPDIQTWV